MPAISAIFSPRVRISHFPPASKQLNFLALLNRLRLVAAFPTESNSLVFSEEWKYEMSTGITVSSMVRILASDGFNFALIDHELPEAVRQMAGLIGYQNTLLAVLNLGGRGWPVPISGPSDKRRFSRRTGICAHETFAKTVGSVEVAALIRRHYGGTNLYVPKCERAMRLLRDILIHRFAASEIRNGQSMNVLVRDLSAKFCLSDRQIWKILKKGSLEERLGYLLPIQEHPDKIVSSLELEILPKQLGEAERHAIAGHDLEGISPDLLLHRNSVEASLHPHSCEGPSPIEQQIAQPSPAEQELSNLIHGHPAQPL